MKISYGKNVYGKEEIRAVVAQLNQTTQMGKSVQKFEKLISDYFSKKYGLMVNSGSSANLLALASFNFKKNSEIITPNLTFSTTVAPIYQLGLVPHFIGVEKNKFLADPSQIERCINKKTVAIMIPNLLGNIANWKRIKSIANKYKLKVIEDSADTIGYTINLKNAGKYSDVTTNSFYASHIINGAGTGGIVCFNDFKLYQKAKLLRGWGRSSAIFNESEGLKLRFNKKVDGIPYDGKYIFSELGYNFLPSEISAAFALEQLKKLKKNINTRIKNFEKLLNFFKNYPELFDLPTQVKGIKTGWLAYPIIIKNNSKIKRQKMQIYLEKRGIQTRTIFTGNIIRQPIMKNKKYKKVSLCSINSDNIMKNGILIGCHQGLKKREIDYVFKCLKSFLKSSNLN